MGAVGCFERSRSPKKWLAEFSAKLAVRWIAWLAWLAGMLAAANLDRGRFIQGRARSLRFHIDVPKILSGKQTPKLSSANWASCDEFFCWEICAAWRRCARAEC